MEQHYKSRAELKQDVKDIFKGNWLYAIILSFLPGMIVFSAINLISIVFSPIYIFLSVPMHDGVILATIIFFFIQLIVAIASIILMIIVSCGILFSFLDWVRGKKMNLTESFSSGFIGFSSKYLKGNIIIDLEMTFFSYMWLILLIIPGVIKIISYSQAFYLYKDYIDEGNKKESDFSDFITESRELMKGHKWEYFVLQLSFLGWFLLSVLTLGIGFIWLVPYQNATYTEFYNNLKIKK